MKRPPHVPDFRTRANSLSAFVLLLLVAGCSSLRVPSRWASGSIAVDGKSDDWAGKSTLLRGEKLAVGFANDTNFVYVMLATADRAITRLLMTQGLTVWFDTSGGRATTFGIHYPLGLFSGRPEGGREGQGDPFGAFRGDNSTAELEVLGRRSDETRRLPVIAANGILARISVSESGFAYELRVPYATASPFPFSIRARSGSVIGVGFVTPEMSPTEGSSEESSGGRSGGRGRGGRGGGGSPTGSAQDRATSAVEPIREWMAVQLVSPDSAGI